jgi:hypothetical protein
MPCHRETDARRLASLLKVSVVATFDVGVVCGGWPR